MWEIWYKIISIAVLSMFKFVAGPLTGAALNIPIVYSMMATTAGMMFSVFIFTYFGLWIRKEASKLPVFNRKKPLFTPKNRAIVTRWQKYGMIGVAFLTPVLLTPIGGTLIAVSFGEERKNILFHMTWAAIVWSIVIHLVVYFLEASFL